MVRKTSINPQEPYDMRFKATRDGFKEMDKVCEVLASDWSKAPPSEKRDYKDLLKGLVDNG